MELTNRERFLRLMRGEPVDRAPFFPCFGPWPETLARWRREGLPEEADYREVVGFDGDLRHILPLNAYLCPAPQYQLLEDEGETVIVVDRGIKQRARKDGHSMPEFLAYPVESRGDWERVKKLLDSTSPERFPPNWPEFCEAHRQRTDPAYAGDLPCGFFGGPRELLGVVRLLLWFYDEPDLMGDILDTLCDLWTDLFARALRDAPIDFFFVWEDMCFKTGPLIGPDTFREFLLPRYRRLTEVLRRSGVDIIMMDSDGDPRLLLPLWLEGGVTCVFPWETQMGLDITQVRRDYPTLQMIGGVNKHALALGREAIDAELRKIPYMLESGRYLPAVDHFVPPDVSWDDYRYFCERLRDLIERYPPQPA
jgi:uroporphyrinogen decarboxylase